MPRLWRGPGVAGWWRPSWPTWPSRRAGPGPRCRSRRTGRGVYAEYLRRAGATATDRWRRRVPARPGLLAAAVSVRSCPCRCCCTASGALGGPDRPYRVRDVLVDLGAWSCVTVRGPRTSNSACSTRPWGDYLLDPASGPFGIDPQEPHLALAEAIAELAPAGSHHPDDPLHGYAAVREAEHLWRWGSTGAWWRAWSIGNL